MSRFILALASAGVLALLSAVACGSSPGGAVPTAATAVAGSPIGGVAVSLAVKAARLDVCHRTGNGSFQLIQVSGNALTAHIQHGDAEPGDSVPGDPTRRFDADCAPVDVSLCQCDFSLSNLSSLGFDSDSVFNACGDTGGRRRAAQVFATSGDNSTQASIVEQDLIGNSRCELRHAGLTLEEAFMSTVEEFQACVDDLNAAAASLFGGSCQL